MHVTVFNGSTSVFYLERRFASVLPLAAILAIRNMDEVNIVS